MSKSNPIKFWWWNGAGNANLGDVLTPLILKHFGIPYVWDKNFEAISTGSIIKVAQPGTMVLGSGILGQKDRVCIEADYRFVRGPLTRQHILQAGGQCPEIYGDPAMLMPLIVDPEPAVYDVGIVPHYIHYEACKQKYPKHQVINMKTKDPIMTIKHITQCRHIVSSSLHGIILAHAYGIPAAWTEFDPPIKGDGVKFLDHYAAVGASAVRSSVKHPVYSQAKLSIAPIIEIFNDLQSQYQ